MGFFFKPEKVWPLEFTLTADKWTIKAVWASVQFWPNFPKCWVHEARFMIDGTQFYLGVAAYEQRVIYVHANHCAIRQPWRLTNKDKRVAIEKAAYVALRQHLDGIKLQGQASLAQREALAAEQRRQREHAALMAEKQAFDDLLSADVSRMIAEIEAGRSAELSISGVADWQLERIASAQREAEWRAAQAAEAAHKEKLKGPIDLTNCAAGIVFGTLVDTVGDLVIPLRKMQHQLVCGTTGHGKSVYLHSLCHQLLRSDDVQRVVLIDLKEGGPTFARYRGHERARVVWRFADIQSVIQQIMSLMQERGDAMAARSQEIWRGQRVVIIIDEFADIQTEVDLAETREDKAAGKRLLANLIRISQRARSFGILLVLAMQRPDQNSIDPSLRANLPCRIVFRLATSAMASSVLDGLSDAPRQPQSLRRGRFIYYDGGKQVLVQAQIAPGIDLDDS